MGTQPSTASPYAAYLAAERLGEVKHEYVRGAVVAMAGGTPEHGRLAANVIGELRRQLAGRPCVTLTSDVRVRVLARDSSTYPDVSVVCDTIERAPDDPDAITNPALIVEVLSESTEASDRGDKFADYRRLPSLSPYLLVSQHVRRLELYRREGAFWVLTEAGPGQTLRLESLGPSLSVDAIYEDPLAPTPPA